MLGSIPRRATALALALALVATPLIWSSRGVGASAARLEASPSVGGAIAVATAIDALRERATHALQTPPEALDLRGLLGFPPKVDPCAVARAEGTLGRSLHGGVLADYLALVRKTAPYAHVTSTFDEPRPGRLHNGYDIGLDAGTPVPCGWRGRVVRITDWYGAETGITVETNGIEVTYGHLVPNVRVGDEIEPGDVVGHVCYNHVDVKMYARDDAIDYAATDPFVDPRLTELGATASRPVEFELRQASHSVPRVTYATQPAI